MFLIFIPLYVAHLFPWLLLRFFSLSPVWRHFIMICLGIICFMLLVLKVCCTSWIYRVMGSRNLGENLTIISSRVFLTCSIMCVIGSWRPSHSMLMICSFLLLFFFSVCFILGNLSSQPISFSATSHLPLQPSGIVFVSHIVIFNSKSSVWSFYIYRGSTQHFLSFSCISKYINNVLITGFTVLAC